MVPWIWFVAGLILLAGEMLTPGEFFMLFMGVSAIIVGAITTLSPGMEVWLQFTLFAIFAALTLLFLRRPLQRRFVRPVGTAEVDSLVGETAVAAEDIGVDAVGKVELRGTTWTARNVASRPLARGERCKVERVEGLTLHIRNQ